MIDLILDQSTVPFVEKAQYSHLSNDSGAIIDNIASWATLQEVEDSDSDAETDELPEESPFARKQLPNSDKFKARDQAVDKDKTTSSISNFSIPHDGELYIKAEISSTLPSSSGNHATTGIEHQDENQTSSQPFQVLASMPVFSQNDIQTSATSVKTPTHGLVGGLNSVFEQSVPPKVRRIKQRQLTSQPVSLQTQDVPALDHANRNTNASSETTSTQMSSTSTRLRGRTYNQWNLRGFEPEDFAGANVSSVWFSKKPNVGSDVVRLNLRHLLEANRKAACASVVGGNEVLSFGTSTITRKQRVAEILEKTFGNGNQGQILYRKPRSTRQKTSREASVESQESATRNIDTKTLGLGSKRKLSESTGSIASKRPWPNTRTAIDDQDTVGDDLIGVWNFKINRLVKGKIKLNKADLQDLKDMLERISILMHRVNVKSMETQKLRESLTRLSVLQDIPFDDEDGLRRRALKLVKAWGAS